MKAVTFQGPYKVEVREVPDPKIEQPTDVVMRVTTASICGSDLHVYNGRIPLPMTGWTLGHEYVGVVEEVGDSVACYKPGDRVVGSFVASCGSCFYCRGRLAKPLPQAEYLRLRHSSRCPGSAVAGAIRRLYFGARARRRSR